jgi:superfamily I DNA/RNA helicase
VIFVGDAAQTIYTFRGAKPENLLKQQGRDYQLTTSFRFGPAIASMANVILFTKEKSPQTTSKKKPKKKTWNPYRLKGGGDTSGYVTSKPLKKSEGKFTVIAFSNATLLMAAVGMMGMPVGEYAPETTQKASVVAKVPDDGEEQVAEEGDDVVRLDLPKFHINGKGEFSGMSRWKKIVKEIEVLYELNVDRFHRMVLPKSNFPEFYDEEVSWDDFTTTVETRELSKYIPTITVLEAYKEQTLEAIELFRAQVMDNPYTAAEADIILSTCHAAKGMEWDRVQLCEGFVKIKSVHENGPAPKKSANKRKRGEEKRDSSWQFLVKDWGDDLNLLYVACTRAKRVLSIP